MGEEVRVDPNEDLDTLIMRLKQSRSKDVVLVLPAKTRALQTLDNFYALRKSARDEGLNLTFSGGNKTMKGLAKLLGFRVEGGEGGEDDIAEFGSGATDQITMPPPQQQRTAVFDNPPGGFVVQQPPAVPPRNGNGRAETMPPPAAPRTPEDFFNDIPDIPSIQPPPMRGDNGFDGGDQVLNRGNAANIFDTFGGPSSAPSTPPPAAPAPAFDFGGGGSEGGSTMSYEEAMKNGLFSSLDNGNLSQDFQFDAEPTAPPLIDEDDIPAVPAVGPDNAAGRFRRPGVRRDDEEFDEPIPAPRGRGGRGAGRAPRPSGARRSFAMPPALAGLGVRVNKILNPVPRTSGGGGMFKPEVSPQERERRRRQSSRTTFYAVIGILVVFVLVILIIMLLLGGGPGTTGPTSGPVATRLNLIYKTTPVTNTVSLLLDTSGSGAGAVSGTSGQTNPSTAGSGAGIGGRLPVSPISADKIDAKGDYPAFGSKLKATGTAQGNITLINGSSQAVGYGAGTVVYTAPNGVSYRLQNAVSVPAGNLFAGTTGRASGIIVADRAGPIGNLPNGFNRYLSSSVAVQAGAISGGAEQRVKVVSKEDIEALKNQLVQKAQQDAQTQLQGKYTPGVQDILVVPGGEPSCQFSKNAGDEADSFSGTCSVSPQAYLYNKTDLQKAVQDQLASDPNNKVDPNSIKITGGGTLKTDNGRMFLQVPASGLTFTPVDLDRLKAAIAGKATADAQAVIASDFPQIDRVDLSNVKDGKLPTDPTQIQIVTTPDLTATTATPVGSSTAGISPAASMSPAASVTAGAGASPTAKP